MNMPGRREIAIAAAGVAGAVALRQLYRAWRAEDIAGRVVLITGGSRGLGLGLARAFAAQGCHIAICARSRGELERARADLEARGAHVLTLECDVSDEQQVERMVATAIEHYGGIDILVNNAGEIQVGPVENMTVADFERAMAIMFWGTVYPTMSLLPHMLYRAGGRIVNITSIGGKISVPHLLPYNCAKFAAVGFSEGLRAELAGTGVKVTTIAPGLMRTGSYLNAYFGGRHDRESAWFGLGASAPFLTISGERAARQIVAATRRGDAERVLGTPAVLAERFHALFPGASSSLLGLVNRLFLPAPGMDAHKRRGSETATAGHRGFQALTKLGRSAAQRFLQPQAVEEG